MLRPSANQPSSQNGRPPLAGVRVLDLTWAMAGPFGTLHLALLGAEVIKIETITPLDATRRGIYALSAGPESSPAFNSLNLSKLGLRLNLKHPEGLRLFMGLAAVSDVLVENFRPGVLERMGLSYETLRRHNPTIIVASSSAFGAKGPESRGPGYAGIFSAVSGLGHLTGYEDGPPTEIRESIDLRVGTSLAYAVLVALYHRQRTGQGQCIDLSSVEAIVSRVGHTIVSYMMTGQVAQRRGNADDVMAPHGVYPSLGSDAWLTIAVGSDGEFEALCHAIGRAEMVGDPHFVTAEQRRLHADELDTQLHAWTRQRTPQEATTLLQAAGVAAMPVLSNKDLLEDPHTNARGVWRQVTHPTLGKQTVQGLPWKSSGPSAPVERPGPLLGQHNGYVLGEVLGIPTHEIERMAEGGVFQ